VRLGTSSGVEEKDSYLFVGNVADVKAR